MQELNSMDGVRHHQHHQPYGNVISRTLSSSRAQQNQHPTAARRGGGGDTQPHSRHSMVAVPQHPHRLQHSSSTIGEGGGAGGSSGVVGREFRGTRRSISIPVIGDNRTGGKG